MYYYETYVLLWKKYYMLKTDINANIKQKHCAVFIWGCFVHVLCANRPS